MFTGIITAIGTVQSIEKKDDWRLVIACPASFLKGVELGASIACSGICLTVIEHSEDCFAVEASQETRDCTTLGAWQAGTHINLERALKMGDELGGHLVTGHVDGLATIEQMQPQDSSHQLILTAPQNLQYYIAPKGSVTLDGISLTVNRVDGPRFEVNIIPHTWQATSLQDRCPGDALNLEIDLMARYLARLQEKQDTA